MPKKSNIWEFFERTYANHAKCKECEKELVLKSGTTSCFLNHLNGQHMQAFLAYERLNDQQNVLPRGHVLDNDSADDEFIISAKRARVVTPAGSYSQTSKSSASAYPRVLKTPKIPKAQNHPLVAMPCPKDHINNVKLVTEETKWVNTDNLPFSMVDSEVFLSIIKQPTKGKYNPVSSRSLSRTRIPQLYQFISDHAKKIVDEEKLNLDGMTFTTDIWTSATIVAFQSLTFHFITSQFKIKRLLVKLETFL